MVGVRMEKLCERPEIHIIRVDDDEIKYFEAAWYIPEGITYNAYLIKLGKENVLVDLVKADYAELFLEKLKELINPEEITHVILNHTEPDHSGALPAFLEANGYRAQLIGTAFARNLVEGFYGKEAVKNFRVVKDGEEIKIGSKTFRFITIPWVHWPDSMITYLVEDRIIFGCDAGGGYSIPETIDDSDEEVVRKYLPYVTKYIVTVIGHYHKYIVQSINKLKKLGIVEEVKMILPGHGLAWCKNPKRIFEHYEAVGAGVPEEGKVLVIYDSMYGFVERRMKVVIDELRKLGKRPVVYRFTDREAPAVSDILGEVPSAEALVIGASTYEAEIHPRIRYTLLEILDKANYEKPVLIVGAFGWGGVAGRKIETLITRSKFDHVATVESKGYPTEEDEEKLREAVRKLVEWTA